MKHKIDKAMIKKHLWVDDIEHAWLAFLTKIDKKFTQLDIELKEEHRYGMACTVISAVYYFKQTELLLEESRLKDSRPQTTPAGTTFDIKYQRQENYSFARIGCAEYYLIPKTAIPLVNNNEQGYCNDLIWIFDWEEKII